MKGTVTEMTESIWNGYKRLDFDFGGREAILIFPDEPNEKKEWMLKTEYFGAFPQLEIDMLGAGYHLAYLKNNNRWGTDEDQRAKRDFAEYLTENYGLARKCICIGMSCGGFHAVAFASRYPSYVSLLYLDAPLLAFRAWTVGFADGEKWAKEQMNAYGFRGVADIITHNDQPIHRLKTLTENRIPVALVYGGADTVVCPKVNSEALIEFYHLENAPIRVWYKPNCDHHPHGLENTAEIIEYIKETSL